MNCVVLFCLSNPFDLFIHCNKTIMIIYRIGAFGQIHSVISPLDPRTIKISCQTGRSERETNILPFLNDLSLIHI